MVQYDRMVLNHLLDTYENSLLSIGENRRKIQIEFRFTRTSIPAYYDESSSEYEKIHILMNALENKNMITVIWKDHKQGHFIQKVRMNADQIDEIYRYTGRKPKHGLEEENRVFLQKYLNEDAPVTVSFVGYLLERLENHKSVKEYITLENLQETEKFFRACVSVEQNKEMDAVELLAEYGIYQTPDFVYFKGDVRLLVEGEEMNLSLLKQGIGISGEDIENIRFSDFSRIQKVITVENLTSFFRCHEENSLLVYLGGYHNRVRRKLLQKIYDAIPAAKYYHFGDIDAGGFLIFLDLRKKTEIPFESFRMDLDTLKQYSQYGKKLTETDKKRLEKLEEEKEFSEVIRYMLEKNIKLEQECIIE